MGNRSWAAPCVKRKKERLRGKQREGMGEGARDEGERRAERTPREGMVRALPWLNKG